MYHMQMISKVRATGHINNIYNFLLERLFRYLCSNNGCIKGSQNYKFKYVHVYSIPTQSVKYTII